MFIVRSAFWLGLAYLVIAPHGGVDDIERQATAAGRDIVAIGSGAVRDAVAGAVMSSVVKSSCGALDCPGGQSLLATALDAARTGPASSSEAPQGALPPFPQPRPAWRTEG